MMKKIASFLILMLIIVVLVGCSSSSPSKTVNGFYNAVNNGDYKKAISFFSSRVIQSVGIQKLQLAIQYQKQYVDSKGGIKKLNIKDEQIYDKNALVVIEIQYGDGTSESGNVPLVKESGKWKIDLSK